MPISRNVPLLIAAICIAVAWQHALTNHSPVAWACAGLFFIPVAFLDIWRTRNT